MTHKQQIDAWVNGNSVDIETKYGKQCCPDFSCCHPELLQPVEIRKAFQAASESERMKFLAMFLGEAMAVLIPEKKVYIAGTSNPEKEN